MSGLQKEAIQMISMLSDDNVNYLVDFIKRFMLPPKATLELAPSSDKKKQAFYEMEQNKSNLSAYFPTDFDPRKEYQEALEERYGNIS